MVNNINNFGVINFYESNSTNSKKEQAKTQQVEDITPFHEENSSKKDQAKEEKENFSLTIPQEGKYSEVRKYLDERKKFDAEFKEFCNSHSLRDLCARLSKEFGWFVDEHSLGANLNRNR